MANIIFEFSLVDSLNKTGELKFTDFATPLVWDGGLNTITAPPRPVSVTVPRVMYQDLIARILEWENQIRRTAPTPNRNFSDYEYEADRMMNGEVLARMTVPPAPKVEFEYDPVADTISLPIPRPLEAVFPWDNWVKFNALQLRMLDLIGFSRL